MIAQQTLRADLRATDSLVQVSIVQDQRTMVDSQGVAAVRSAVVGYADEVDVIRNSLSQMETATWGNVSDYTHAEQQLINSSSDSELKRRTLGMSTGDALRSFPLDRIRRYPEIAAAFRLHAIVMANRVEVLRRARGPMEDRFTSSMKSSVSRQRPPGDCRLICDADQADLPMTLSLGHLCHARWAPVRACACGYLAAAIGLAVCGCDRSPPVRAIPYSIARVIPHDTAAYTQGLVFLDEALYESGGRYGASTLRRIDPETGAVLQEVPLPAEYFGEGLAAVGSELVQLTWKAGKVFVYDPDSLTVRRTYTYDGEGWGLCYDGQSLFMSNGTDTLYERSAATFHIVSRQLVTKDGFPVSRLNELECVGGDVWANVFLTDEIVRIDKTTGHVRGTLDGRQVTLLGMPRQDPEAVLNGIAYWPSRGTFLVTGKLWPKMLELRLEGGA